MVDVARGADLDLGVHVALRDADGVGRDAAVGDLDDPRIVRGGAAARLALPGDVAAPRRAASISMRSTTGLVFGPVEIAGPPRSLHGTTCWTGRS